MLLKTLQCIEQLPCPDVSRAEMETPLSLVTCVRLGHLHQTNFFSVTLLCTLSPCPRRDRHTAVGSKVHLSHCWCYRWDCLHQVREPTFNACTFCSTLPCWASCFSWETDSKHKISAPSTHHMFNEGRAPQVLKATSCLRSPVDLSCLCREQRISHGSKTPLFEKLRPKTFIFLAVTKWNWGVREI